MLRLGAMAGLVLALTLTAIFAFHQAYANQGKPEIEKLEKELDETRAKHSVEVNNLRNEMNRMRLKHEEEMANKVSSKEVEELEDMVADLKKENRDLQDEARLYRDKLLKCELQN